MTTRRGRAGAAERAGPAPKPLPGGPRYLFFGGKGGVGKTTAAAAAALYLLDRATSDEQILLFSTDPAHSLSDSLNVDIGDRLVEVTKHKRARLFAYEMDANRALADFKARHKATLSLIAERGTLLDEGDISELFDLSLPGMDEVMALVELAELGRSPVYSHVVVDTAPSGHTSRLLRLPGLFEEWIGALDRMADKHRFMVSRFARGGPAREDEVDRFLREMAERLGQIRSMLFDDDRAAFTLVTVPDGMSVEETLRYRDLLEREGVPRSGVIINRVEDSSRACPYCRARARGQKPWLERLAREFEQSRISKVPLMGSEVRGFARLRQFAKMAWSADARLESVSKVESVAKTETAGGASEPEPKPTGRNSGFVIEPSGLLIFGGKGGVGKTSAAAAAALELAERYPDTRVLLFSTDPAHSLSDSFGEQIGEYKKGVGGRPNLDGMEIDPGAWFERLKKRYRAWADDLFDSLTAGSRWEVQFDREAMRELIQLSPPGIDEIAALGAISDLVDEGRYGSIVLDTAPTGHLVRFLELPEVAASWVRALLKLLLKYKDVARWGGVAEELIGLSKAIKRLTALLTDPARCEFVAVALPETMSLEETARLGRSLERLNVPLRRLLINSVVGADAAQSCAFCAARRRQQQKVVRAFRQTFMGKAKLFVAPQHRRGVIGPARLRNHFLYWRSLN